MKKIDKLEDLVKIISCESEIIIYGMGNVSKQILRWLDYRGMLSNVSCIAVSDLTNNPLEYKDKQVYPISDLGIFYRTSSFIICTSEEKHNEICDSLLELGCVYIYIISNSVFWHINYEVENLNNDIKFQLNYQNEIVLRKMLELQYRIEEQNEVCAVNTVAFSEFENAFRGRDVVIVATGPTLKYYNPIKNAIHIGVNFAFRREDLIFDFYFVQDSTRIRKEKLLEDEIMSALENVKGNVFIGKYLHRSMHMKNEYPDYIFTRKVSFRKYFLDGCYTSQIYQNICLHPIMDAASVTFPAIQFALFAHPKRIFLVGCDTNENGYFNDLKTKQFLLLNICKMGYLKIKAFAKQYYPDVEIISINPVGLKGLFNDYYTDGCINKISKIDTL